MTIDANHGMTPQPGLTRRSALTVAAWSAPVIAASTMIPLATASDTLRVTGAHAVTGTPLSTLYAFATLPTVITVKDAAGAPVTGASVTLTTPAGRLVGEPLVGTTNADGEAYFELSPATPSAPMATDAFTILATAAYGTQTGTTAFPVTVDTEPVWQWGYVGNVSNPPALEVIGGASTETYAPPSYPSSWGTGPGWLILASQPTYGTLTATFTFTDESGLLDSSSLTPNGYIVSPRATVAAGTGSLKVVADANGYEASHTVSYTVLDRPLRMGNMSDFHGFYVTDHLQLPAGVAFNEVFDFAFIDGQNAGVYGAQAWITDSPGGALDTALSTLGSPTAPLTIGRTYYPRIYPQMTLNLVARADQVGATGTLTFTVVNNGVTKTFDVTYTVY